MRDVFKNIVESSSIPNFMGTKAEIVTHFRDTIGEKNWIRQAAIEYSGAQPGSKEYKSARRQFEGERLTKEPAKETGKARFKEIGEKLPSIGRTPKGDVTVTVTGKQDNGRKGGYRERTITVTLKGSDAYSFVNDPNFQTIWDAGDYPDFGEGDEDGGSGSMYEMTVA